MAFIGLGASLEGEMSRLRVENQALSEELAQCQADKEFVWSLWKRLQVASPDITQAIGMVVQREKEKAEIKDRKVLCILASKDEKIDELQRVVSSQSAEVSAILTNKLELSEKISHLIAENEELKAKQGQLQSKVEAFEKRSKELEEKEDMARSLTQKDEEVLSLRRDKEDLTTIRDSQKVRINALEDELQEARDRYRRSCDEITDMKATVCSQEKRMDDLKQDINHKDKELEAVRHEMADLWSRHHQLTDHASQQAQLIEQLRSLQTDTQKMMKNQEDAFSIESSSIYSILSPPRPGTTKDISPGLAPISPHPHPVKLYSELKSNYTALLATDQDRMKQLVDCRQQMQDQAMVITDLKRQLEEGHNRSVSTQATLEDKEVQAHGPEAQIEYRLQTMQKEMDTLKEKMIKDRVVDAFDGSYEDLPVSRGSPLPSPRHSSTPGRSAARSRLDQHYRPSSPYEDVGGPRAKSVGSGRRKERVHSFTPPDLDRKKRKANGKASDRTARTQSCSPERRGDVNMLHKKLRHAESRLQDTKELLRYRCAELEEVRGAHDRRLERLKALQVNYRLCRKQLKIQEEELNGPTKKRKKPKRSTDPKALQKENSDAVWNELAYFKTEHKNLRVDKMNLQEELDTLRVKSAQDAATIHELRTCLEQEKEELAFLLEHQRAPSPQPEQEQQLEAAVEEATSARKEAASQQQQVVELRKCIQQAEEKSKATARERDALYAEKRALRSETNGLHQELAERRMEITDLKRDLLRVQRDLKRKKKKEKGKPGITKQYQKVLNRSIQTMSHIFDDFDKEGWEEVSETSINNETGTTDVTATTDSLGAAIAHTAKFNSPDNTRQLVAEEDHIQRIGKKNELPEQDISPMRRDIALSPIPIISQPASTPHVLSKKSTASPSASQLNTLRQRITSLQKQVAVLREAKNVAVKKEAEQRRALELLQGDLQLANHRLSNSRSTCQRLTSDVERLKAANEDLETKVDVATIDSSSSQQICMQQEHHNLQARLKTSTGELSKQLTQIKDLKAENATQAEKITTLTNKLNHTERDLAQKRILVDDLRFKVKVAQENAQTDTEVMAEAEGKLKHLAETNSRYKTQMESTQQRISAVAREKRENEDKVIRLSQELEKKTKLVSDLQRKNRELESALAQLEKTAEQQLLQLAEQSETAMDVAQKQLKISTAKLQEFNKFVRVLGHTLITSLQQSRSLLRQHDKRQRLAAAAAKPPVEPSLAQAQRMAADILNLSQSDVDDLMGMGGSKLQQQEEDEPSDVDAKKDKKWKKKWEKTLTCKSEFCMPLVELFMEKLEEKSDLAIKLSAM